MGAIADASVAAGVGNTAVAMPAVGSSPVHPVDSQTGASPDDSTPVCVNMPGGNAMPVAVAGSVTVSGGDATAAVRFIADEPADGPTPVVGAVEFIVE